VVYQRQRRDVELDPSPSRALAYEATQVSGRSQGLVQLVDTRGLFCDLKTLFPLRETHFEAVAYTYARNVGSTVTSGASAAGMHDERQVRFAPTSSGLL
jgi:hypothetical protein